jgi:hypothetical protein
MFRYNTKGGFNVPYGGIAYNSKGLIKKYKYMRTRELISYLKETKIYNLDFIDFFNKGMPKKNDFIFLDPPYDTEFSTYAENIFNQNSSFVRPFNGAELAIHVRRGDYLSNKKARAFHGICSMDYYLEATLEMLRQFPQITKIQIFSDEYRFAEELKHLLLHLNLEINLNSKTGAVSVLAEMSNSKYFIGCNSTFSWWATALNENRITILPSQWFLDPSRAITNNRFFLPGVRVLNTTLF